MKFFGEGPRMPAPATGGTSIEEVKKQRDERANSLSNSKKRESEESVKLTQKKKTTRSDNEETEKHRVDIERMEKMPLKTKEKKDKSDKKKKKKDMGKDKSPREEGKKKATFAETVRKEKVNERVINYKKCVVGFAIRVDKGNNTNGGFVKEVIKGLAFMLTYIDQDSSFHSIGMDKTLKPIKEKGNMPKYEKSMRNYFNVPNLTAFDNVSQDGGRVIKRLAIIGFTGDPQRCLDNAASNLRMMRCAIFYKKCQEVDTVASQILAGEPNTIEEEIIKETMNEELKVLENKLLLTNINYKLTREQSRNWVEYAVVREFDVSRLEMYPTNVLFGAPDKVRR